MAGLIFLSQQSLNSSQGFIQSINNLTGELIVSGKRVQINDPKIPIVQPDGSTVVTGRHTNGQSPDERFSVDQDNPTIRSETGYPMCIPRSATSDDPRCPQRNRPRVGGVPSGALIYNFTMDPPRTNPLSAPDLTKTDPWEQMPFEVGDFVTYWGVVQGDGSISAYQVIGNVGAYTFPGTEPCVRRYRCSTARYRRRSESQLPAGSYFQGEGRGILY